MKKLVYFAIVSLTLLFVFRIFRSDQKGQTSISSDKNNNSDFSHTVSTSPISYFDQRLAEEAKIVEEMSWNPKELADLKDLNDSGEETLKTLDISQTQTKNMLKIAYGYHLEEQKDKVRICNERKKCNPTYILELERSVKIATTVNNL